MSDRMLSCRELIDFLWAYVSEELSAGERKEFDRHLAVCPSCVAYLDSYRKTIEMERAVVTELGEEACEDAPEELIRAVLVARKARDPEGES